MTIKQFLDIVAEVPIYSELVIDFGNGQFPREGLQDMDNIRVQTIVDEGVLTTTVIME